MKKKFLFPLLIFISSMTFSENYYDFFLKQNPKEQVKLILDEFENHDSWRKSIKFATWVDIIVDNSSYTKTYLLQELINIQSDKKENDRLEILLSILSNDFLYNKELLETDREIIVNNLNRILKIYLEDNKKLDKQSIFIYASISEFKTMKYPLITRDDFCNIINYFNTLGICEINIDWEDLGGLY